VNWDLDVGVVCTGYGVAGLATAIAAVDFGSSVFVTSSLAGAITRTSIPSVAVPADRLNPLLLSDVSDAETSDYLLALSSDLGPLRRGVRTVDVPISVVQDVPVEAGRTIAPFVGARLRDWAARCLASPYGFLHTRLADFGTTTQRIADGENIEVAEIGSMSADLGNVGDSVLDWVTAQARDRAIEMQPNCSLQRLVIEDGDAVGAVFSTPDGPLAVHARYGVTFATSNPRINMTTPHQYYAGGAEVKVCLVGRQASRFGRLELITSEPLATDTLSSCRPDIRQVQASLRQTRGQSPAGRCAWGDGYPTVGR
jgi:hypothetical protein